MFDRTCNDCRFAVWDYEEYEGGYKRWYFDSCLKDLDGASDDCEGWKANDT